MLPERVRCQRQILMLYQCLDWKWFLKLLSPLVPKWFLPQPIERGPQKYFSQQHHCLHERLHLEFWMQQPASLAISVLRVVLLPFVSP